MMTLHRILRPALAVSAGILLYLGERVLPATPAHGFVSGAGAAALLAALSWTLALWWRTRRQSPGAAGAWRIASLPLGLCTLAGMAYGATLLPARFSAGQTVSDVLNFGWALALVVGAIWLLFVELSLWSQGPAATDSGRVRRAALAGLNLGLLAAVVIVVNFSANRMPWQWDVAYFKTTEPSQATRDAVAALENPIDVALVFPADDEVGRLAGDYFRKLGKSGPGKLKVLEFDADLKPLQARDFKARANGTVIFKRDEQIKPLQLGLSIERARGQLRKFDGDVLATLQELARERRMAYFTLGHGERNEHARDEGEPETGVTSLEGLLRAKGYQIKPLGLAQGLGTTVPDDAALMIIAAPVDPFTKAEGQSIRRYLERGGQLLVLLEPQPGQRPSRLGSNPLLDVLEAYGIKFENVILANDRIFARRTFTDADHALLVTTAYGPHPAANTVRRAPDQFPLLLLTAGALQKGQDPPNLQIREVVKAMPGTWGDRNGNFRFDPPGETRDTPALALGVGPADKGQPAGKDKEPKRSPAPQLLVFADADVASDLLMQNRANSTLLADSLAWLAGDEAPPGLPTSEEDQRIQHAKGDEWLWFYLPVVGMPALVLLLGMVAISRRRQLARSGA
jgi:hypothetical protein